MTTQPNQALQPDVFAFATANLRPSLVVETLAPWARKFMTMSKNRLPEALCNQLSSCWEESGHPLKATNSPLQEVFLQRR